MFLAGSRVKPKTLGLWLRKGFWAVADQGLFAASNFVLNVLLARWMFPQDYGAFAMVFAAFLLFSTLHGGLLIEPVLVFGPGRYQSRLSEYLGSLLYGHLGFAVLSGFLFLLVGLGFWISGSRELSAVFLTLALSGPCILLLWLLRRACYARFEPSLAASGGVLYMALMLTGAYALHRLEWLSAPSAFSVMGVSSLVVSLWLIVRLRVKLPSFREHELAREAFADHWRYGRFTAAVQVLLACPLSVYFLLLPALAGLEASASLRALMNLIMPMILALNAFAALMLPTLVQARGDAVFGAVIRFALAFFVFGSLVYWLFLGLFYDRLVAWLYGGQYTEDAHLLWILGLLPVAYAVGAVLIKALEAFERPDQEFRAAAFSTAVSLTLGLVVVFAWGLFGAVVSLVASSVALAVAVAYYYFVTIGGSVKAAADREGSGLDEVEAYEECPK